MSDGKNLTKYEIAAVTSGVPCTGDPALDAIITQGLRYKTSVELLKAFHSSGLNLGSSEMYTFMAIELADNLLAEFRKKKNGAKK